jgi:beta-aspartyl-peptidase (threonine type)
MLKPNRVLIVALAASFVAALCPRIAAGQKKNGEPSAVRQIRAVLERQVEAWNRRDLEAFMSGYWQSPDLSFYSGASKTSSWQATLERYRNRYQSEGREMGHLDFSELEIEMLGPQSAFVRGRWRLKMKSEEPGGLFTLIFRKFRDGWKIVHDHTC